MWIEKSTVPTQAEKEKQGNTAVVKGPQLQRDSWMAAPIDLFPTITRKEIRDAKKAEAPQEKKIMIDQLGQHERELNPYWKEGGTGLPEERGTQKKTSAPQAVGDGGYSWMKKAYDRCVEQAKEENRTLEDVASEKYGSLEKLESMLKSAEKANKEIMQRNGREGFSREMESRKQRFMKPEESNRGRQRGFIKPSEDTDSYYDKYSGKDSRSRGWRRERSRSRERRSRSRERRSRERRSRSRERRSRSGERNQARERSRSNSRERRRSRSKERTSYRSKYDDKSASDGLKSRFIKPGQGNSYRTDNKDREKAAAPAWRKKEFHKTVSPEKEEEDRKRPACKESKRKEYSESSSSSSSESSSDEDSRSDGGDEKMEQDESSRRKKETIRQSKEEEEEEVVVLLSEKEMNQLGAKIVRAEIMGNTALATKLKEQLEKARENNDKHKDAMPPGGEKKKKEEDVVVLARTGASGISRPVADREHETQRGKRRRKKEKVLTHGKSGERERYFADDDRFDLKQMVEREKMGTAEDQNSMFSRLAGRSVDKTNDDYDLDDMFVNRANAKESGAKMEDKERALAIREHKNISDCQMCFDKTPKHLIVCIGTKVYLCLPNCKSLCEGHCLIVPIQHSVSGTVVDEDVWNEIQVFRKALTQMFQSMDQDVVFMETCMGLRYHPHMYIECVPMEKETGDLAPIYFKKAIQESESEWSDNKKLVDLSKKDVRRSIPKGFPYFAVDFGMQGGYAHVIEDERQFPKYFGKEVVGGMIDAEPRLWRRPQKEGFEDQRKKVLQFADWWKPYDWTTQN
ncbi:CWF19-like protein 2 isoform X2 [Crassostrea virginica]